MDTMARFYAADGTPNQWTGNVAATYVARGQRALLSGAHWRLRLFVACRTLHGCLPVPRMRDVYLRDRLLCF